MEFSFDKNQTVDNLETVPEDFRGFYVEGEDKKFKIDDKFKKATTAIDGLSKTTKTLRTEEKKLRAAAEGFAALGATPEEVKQKLDDLNAQLSSKEKINPEKIKEEVAKAFQKQIEDKDKVISKKDKAINKYLVKSQATDAIAAAKGVPDLLLPHIERQVKVVEDGEDYKVTVVDAAGETRYGSSGAPLTIAELVAGMKTDKVFGRAFESESNGGGGANPGGSKQKVQTKQNDAPKTAQQKISAGLAKRAAG